MPVVLKVRHTNVFASGNPRCRAFAPLAGGATGLTDKQIRGVDTLVTAWRGQGGVAVGSALRGERLIAARRDGVLSMRREPV